MIKINVEKKLLTSKGPVNLRADLHIEQGEFVSLFGPSGTGKTTILRMIAGLSKPDAGRIVVDDEIWFDSETNVDLSPQKRKVGFVFQDYALFPNMTVREHLEFAADQKDQALINELLAVVHLKELEHRRPQELSGGQRQRVALALSIARKPRVFLLDEPLAALDIDLRARLQDEIIKFYQEFGITTIFVSHDLSEIFKLSSRTFMLDEKGVVRSGNPSELFLESDISGKFRFVGEVVSIEIDEVVATVSVLIGNRLTQVVATRDEAIGFKVGDRVIVAAKAFNPIIMKYTA